MASITPRLESGEGSEADKYTPPSGANGDYYLRVPFDYWLTGDPTLHERLTLPEKAMLLISLARLKNEFRLTAANAARWYGVSQETAQRGLQGLVEKKVLGRRRERRAAPEAPEGFTIDTYYSLTGAFRLPKRVATDQAAR
ncbi:hypothetical protein ACFQY7_30935 [Actinomadura luteofluorescens]|uniref:hypothetical protein n=1 Tax=Actinomadura luteofluorescens TaxID=46163 RepID=UPI0036416CAE